MIAIIDYGMGNLRSVQKGFARAGYQAEIVQQPEQVDDARAVVLPGVGAFADAMENLKKSGMVEAIKRVVQREKPFLGICLGQQLLFESSEEFGKTKGLGILPGTVKRFPAGTLKVPHMGWNQIEIKQASPLLEGISNGSAFYFVHSYHVAPTDDNLILCLTDYGVRFPAVVGKANVFGIQFHPEKSSTLGIRILENFGKMVRA
ncbi:imidazole glycerol phosphate synthase subunit hisH [Desulforamulus reducens MI-1]|uniref:Imidazole glycerol phosphate synthase subunit HisH n=1 Tax=Desulforamulus reducens (strain ATCC BAA-1160 / DSM 100696 / MI-1) TaxID=349161 RepID=A4J709_DESRM|nr:imidazole glycerol phosphate synthase subunit HisH [Desulforamulus reducens]ABO50862.1 imidazole glycerol phosphate synthase subunit hisH [Desulforamulus reducens MI-1]